MKEHKETEQKQIKDYWREYVELEENSLSLTLDFDFIENYVDFVKDYNLSHHKAEKLDDFIDNLLDYLTQYKIELVYGYEINIVNNIIEKVKELGGIDNE